MRSWPLIPSLLLTLALSLLPAIASANDDAVGNDRVSVTLVNPDQFAEVRQNRNNGDVRDGSWLERLRKYVVSSAGKRLPPDQTLDIRITDIKRAGDFEPWRGAQFNDVRIVKDIYPPRIALSFTLKAADGSVLAEGDKVLRDPGFLSRGLRNDDDPLRHEKRLLDDWLADLLPRRKN